MKTIAKKSLLLLPLMFLFASPAQAIMSNTFVYSKTILKIVPRAQDASQTPETPAEPKKPGDIVLPDNMIPKLRRVPKEFTVEIRQPSFLDQKDFIEHQPFTDKEGMLITIDPPAEAEVKATRMIASADVLFVDQDGYIIKIAPSLKLMGLTEPVDSGKPIHAFVYLKAGTAAASDIQVGDRIEGTYFKTHPVVIE